MSKLLLPFSVSLIASLSFGIPARADIPTISVIENHNSLCSDRSTNPAGVQSASSVPAGQSFLRSGVLLAQKEIIVNSRPNRDSKCGPYYTVYKNGKFYECHKCTYGGPYCWEKN